VCGHYSLNKCSNAGRQVCGKFVLSHFFCSVCLLSILSVGGGVCVWASVIPFDSLFLSPQTVLPFCLGIPGPTLVFFSLVIPRCLKTRVWGKSRGRRTRGLYFLTNDVLKVLRVWEFNAVDAKEE